MLFVASSSDLPWRALFRCRPMPVPGLSLLGLKRIRGFASILRYINPTIIIIIFTYLVMYSKEPSRDRILDLIVFFFTLTNETISGNFQWDKIVL